MKSKKLLRILVFLIILFLVVNLVLFALKIVSAILFWIVTILAAIFAYKYLPKMIK